LDIFGDILDNPGGDSKIFADSTEGKKGYFQGIHGKKIKKSLKSNLNQSDLSEQESLKRI